ncbi:hypothetical protein ACNF49_14240 [Actinomadura sp. ATCC 39365]
MSFRPRSEGPVAPPPLPPLPAAPPAPVRTVAPSKPAATAAADVPAAFWSDALPRAGTMGPPAALMMPPPPPLPALPDAGSSEGQSEDGEFAPPAPADPDNPTGREVLQTCMTLVTALGVAAAKGMWGRARHRHALADEARAIADKAKAKAAAHGGQHGSHGAGQSGGKGGGKGGSRASGGLLSGLGQEGAHRKRRGGHGGGHGGGSGGGTGPKGNRKGPKSPKNRPDKDGHGRWPKAPKTKNKNKNRKDRDGFGTEPCLKNRKPRKAIDAPKTKRAKDSPSPKATKDGKKKQRQETPKGPAPLRWKAPKNRPDAGPGGGKALPPGRKRWARPRPAGKKRFAKPISTRGRTSWARWRRRTPAWLADWWAPASRVRPAKARRTRSRRSWIWRAKSPAGARRPSGGEWGRIRPPGWQHQQQRTPPPPPPRGAQWMRPPPAADRTVRVEHAELVDVRPQPQYEPDRPTSKAVTGAGRPALGPAPSTPPTPGPAASPARDESLTAQPPSSPLEAR